MHDAISEAQVLKSVTWMLSEPFALRVLSAERTEITSVKRNYNVGHK